MSTPLTKHSLASSSSGALALGLCLGLVSLSASGCDDDSDPKFVEGGVSAPRMRDMTVDVIPENDMFVPNEMDMTLQADAAPPPIDEPACTEGEIRLKEPCGYERCRLGEWIEPSSYRESCNGHDDDCDNTVDETFNIGAECFTRVDGCSVAGSFACDPATLSVSCIPGEDQGPNMELCDGIDNDCDNTVDEDFPDQVCCTENIHCATGANCEEGLCVGQTVDPNLNDPNDPLPENMGLMGDGTCGSPIRLGGFGVYYADASAAENTSYAAGCTGVSEDDDLIFGGTLLGREVVFTLNLPQTQRVRLSTELTFFDNVIYVRRGSCNDLLGTVEHCADSQPLATPPKIAELEFEALANQTYYVIVDTTMNPIELLEFLGVGDLGDIPFILTFDAAQ